MDSNLKNDADVASTSMSKPAKYIYTGMFRSGLSRAKGLGSSHHGVNHWWHQRLSAILLIALTLWLVCFVLSINLHGFIKIATKPHNVILGLMFILTSLYHGMLGVQVVIEDYVHCTYARNFLLVTLKGLTFVTIVSSIVSLMYWFLQMQSV